MSDQLHLAARALAVEAQAAAIVGELRAAGVDALLLKGASIERWLYEPAEWRVAADVDLLVSPARFAGAERRLQALGFANRYDGAAPTWTEEHADVWRSDASPVPLDLHRRIWGLRAGAGPAWERLWAGRELLTVAGSPVPVLGESARALALALHAAHHGTAEGRHVRDLGRAIERVEEATWAQAAALAADLGGEAELAAGLALAPGGPALAERLGVQAPDERSAPGEHLWALPPTGDTIVRLGRARGWREKGALLRAEMLPSSGFMRTRASYGRLARRGRLGLACAHLVRWAHLVRDVPGGLRAARRLRGR